MKANGGANVPPYAPPEMKEFIENRATLMKKLKQWRTQNPNGGLNSQTFAQFQKKNAALLKRQNELAQIISRQQPQIPMRPPPALQVPPNASPQLKALLTARDKLVRDRFEFADQHRTDDPATRQAAMQQWEQQNIARVQEIGQLAQALSDQQAEQLRPLPPPLEIPPNASPQERAFLKTRDELMRERIEFANQHRNDDPNARRAAMEDWDQQNTARFQQLQQEALAMTQGAPSIPAATTK